MKKNDHETHEDRTVVKETHSGGTTLNLIDRWHAEAEKMEMIRHNQMQESIRSGREATGATKSDDKATKQQNNKANKKNNGNKKTK